MLNPIRDIAWAAGLFEGEGCITVRPRARRSSVQMTLYNTELDIVCAFADIIQVGSITGPFERGRYKPMWQWNAYGKTARTVIRVLRPYFLSRRGLKADEALATENR